MSTDLSIDPDEAAKTAEIIHHLGKRLFLVFSSSFFLIEFKTDLPLLKDPGWDLRGLWTLPTIHDACLNTTLMAIRDLDDFFTPRSSKSREDDLRASDLGYAEGLGFLTVTERRRINKLVMHSTASAIDQGQDASWDISELSAKCISQGLQFLNWIQANLDLVKYPESVAAASFYKIQIENIGAYIKKSTGHN